MMTVWRGIWMGVRISMSHERDTLKNQMVHIFRLNEQLVKLREKAVAQCNGRLTYNVLQLTQAYDQVEKQMFTIEKFKHTAELLRRMIYDVEAELNRYEAWKATHSQA